MVNTSVGLPDLAGVVGFRRAVAPWMVFLFAAVVPKLFTALNQCVACFMGKRAPFGDCMHCVQAAAAQPLRRIVFMQVILT
jgi:hypothetical protein